MSTIITGRPTFTENVAMIAVAIWMGARHLL